MSRFARLATAAAAAALLAGPALAKKPAVIKLPASSLADPDKRLCMPKSTMAKPAADLPNTVCQTQAEWAAAGVTIQPR